MARWHIDGVIDAMTHWWGHWRDDTLMARWHIDGVIEAMTHWWGHWRNDTLMGSLTQWHIYGVIDAMTHWWGQRSRCPWGSFLFCIWFRKVWGLNIKIYITDSIYCICTFFVHLLYTSTTFNHTSSSTYLSMHFAWNLNQQLWSSLLPRMKKFEFGRKHFRKNIRKNRYFATC